MILSWRRRRSSTGKKKNNNLHLDGVGSTAELVIPAHFRCPISLDLMRDPVTLTTGITYDRHSIETWIESGNATCPITNQLLQTLDPIPNHSLRKLIQDWCVLNRSFGVDRIPTPRVPITSSAAADLAAKISSAASRRDSDRCGESVAKMKAVVRESERNKRCVASNGAASALASAFDEFSTGGDNSDEVLEEILSALTLVLSPLTADDAATKARLSSESSLRCMVRFMDAGDLSRRRNSVLVVKHIVSGADENRPILTALSDIAGALEALVKMVREPICPASRKASLMVIYHMVRSESENDNKIRERFVEMGLVSFALEMLVDSDRSFCEKLLGVVDGILWCGRGRDVAYGHALTVAAVVKKILRVSDLATEFSISILWKLMCIDNDNNNDKGVVIEALQVGAFQKLLLVLQVGCGERVKEKSSELLKLLNLHRGALLLDCVDSMDFKHLKRPFP